MDSVKVGTYDASTNTWTDGATYSITRNGNNFAVSGEIPYGEADSIFGTAGNRFAVRISKNGITSTSDLPTGNIVKTTNTEAASGYNIGTRSAFESDGSLIAIFAPTAETKDAYDREVKIAWTKAGSTVQESDYTVYTFDLSEATLQEAPETLTPFEEEQTLTGFDFGDVSNDETNADFYTLISGLTYDDNDEATLLTGTATGNVSCGIYAKKNEINYSLYAFFGESELPLYEVTGYKNLTNGKFMFPGGATVTVDENGIKDSTPATWNGIYIGAVTE